MSFEARYGGECNDCGAYFSPGTLVRYDDTAKVNLARAEADASAPLLFDLADVSA